MTETDFAFYENEYKGNVVPFSLYLKYELKARKKVDILTQYRIKEMTDDVRLCVCEVMDYLYKNNEEEIKELDLRDILLQYLPLNLCSLQVI